MLAVEHPIVRATFAPYSDDALLHEQEAVSDDAAEARSELQAIKGRVPSAIDTIGSTVWRSWVEPVCTRQTVPGQTPPINRAYHKMKEMLRSCCLSRRIETSVHLCEAPGGFVQAVEEWVDDKAVWKWCAVSLPQNPAFATDRLPLHCGAILFADVLHDDVLAQLQTSSLTLPVDLVTADGAVAMDHSSIESEHLPLLRAQILLGLQLLRPGGTLVVKCFEVLQRDTCELVGQLTHAFRYVSIIKPNSSRPSNSERYIVCTGFDGTTTTLHTAVRLSEQWRATIGRITARMAKDQSTCLQRFVFRAISCTKPDHRFPCGRPCALE